MIKTKTARDGTTYTEHYNYKGKLHNLEGPAIKWHDCSYEEYWINGELLTPEQFLLANRTKTEYNYSSAVIENEDSITFWARGVEAVRDLTMGLMR